MMLATLNTSYYIKMLTSHQVPQSFFLLLVIELSEEPVEAPILATIVQIIKKMKKGMINRVGSISIRGASNE